MAKMAAKEKPSLNVSKPSLKVEKPQLNAAKSARMANSDLDADPSNPFSGVDIEAEAEVELSEALRAFKERAAQADQRFLDNTDSEYWVAIGFQNRAMKEEFLRKLKLIEIGDKYLDGMEVAKVLGIQLETPIPAMPRFGHDRKLHEYAQPLDEPYPTDQRVREVDREGNYS